MFVKKYKLKNIKKDGCIKLKITFKITLPEIMICLLHYIKYRMITTMTHHMVLPGCLRSHSIDLLSLEFFLWTNFRGSRVIKNMQNISHKCKKFRGNYLYLICYAYIFNFS